MRHTHATLLLEDGVSLKVVAGRLGDREDTVVKLYGHVTPRGRALAVASVGTWWEQEGPGVQVEPESELSRLRAAIVELEEEVTRLKAAGSAPGANRERTP
jgi:hypothetical protein